MYLDIELLVFLSVSIDSVFNYTRLWRRVFIDKFGIGVRRKDFFESLIKEWSLLVLFEECFEEIRIMFLKVVICFRNVDFDFLEEIREVVMCDGFLIDLMKFVKFDIDF